jgi:hypothetical protein
MRLGSNLLLAVALLAGAPISIHAEQVLTNVLSFDGVTPGPVDGLTVQGVTFGFRVGGVASTAATIGLSGGPGPTPLNSPPNLEGPANGILTLNFSTPTLLLRFGSHLSTTADVPLGLTVQIFDASFSPVGAPIPLAMPRTPNFAGGTFVYSGGVVGRAVIDFNDAAVPVGSRFTLDNLTYTVVPEPKSAWLVFPALAFWAVWRWRRPAAR